MGLDPKSVPPSRQEDDVPYWRREFPIDVREDQRRNRRSFLGGVTLAGGVMACGQIALHQVRDDERSATSWTVFEPVTLPKKWHEIQIGEALLFHFPDDRSPCLFVRLGEEEYVAFAQKCTHLACPVIPDISAEALHCPCHHGKFDLRTGDPTAGPPRNPLPRIQVEVELDGSLTARRRR